MRKGGVLTHRPNILYKDICSIIQLHRMALGHFSQICSGDCGKTFYIPPWRNSQSEVHFREQSGLNFRNFLGTRHNRVITTLQTHFPCSTRALSPRPSPHPFFKETQTDRDGSASYPDSLKSGPWIAEQGWTPAKLQKNLKRKRGKRTTKKAKGGKLGRDPPPLSQPHPSLPLLRWTIKQKRKRNKNTN